jgi:hypothetical protein
MGFWRGCYSSKIWLGSIRFESRPGVGSVPPVSSFSLEQLLPRGVSLMADGRYVRRKAELCNVS